MTELTDWVKLGLTFAREIDQNPTSSFDETYRASMTKVFGTDYEKQGDLEHLLQEFHGRSCARQIHRLVVAGQLEQAMSVYRKTPIRNIEEVLVGAVREYLQARRILQHDE